MTGRRSEKGEHEMNVNCQWIYILVSGIYRTNVYICASGHDLDLDGENNQFGRFQVIEKKLMTHTKTRAC